MRTNLLRKLTLGVTIVVLLLVTSLALADTVYNNLDATVDADYEIMSLVVNGTDGSTTLSYHETNGDGKGGCNLTGPGSQLTVSVNSSNTSVASVSPASVTFENCSAVQTITVHPVAAGTANITLEFVSATTDDKKALTSAAFDLLPARFTVNVAPVTTNHPPVVTVTGVANDATYDFGSVPAAGCSVSDQEDGTPIVSPVLSAITGPLSSYGLGLQTATCSYTDAGGLTTAVSATYTIVDRHAPTANPSITAGTAGTNDWYTSDVTVTWNWSDIGVGIDVANCTTSSTSSGEGEIHLTATCKDLAGNEGTANFTVQVDKTAPTAVLAAYGTKGNNGWFIDDVTITTTGTDDVSGIVSCTDVQSQTTETSGTVFDGSCTNGAGLKTDATSLTVKLDKTGPSADLSAVGTLGKNDWYTSNVTIKATGTDTISNLTTCTADQSLTTDTAGTVFNGSCTNDAGLTTKADPLTIKRDATPPTITATLDKDVAVTGWYNIATGAPTVSFKCDDNLSGIASGACPAAYTFPEGAGQSYSQTVSDLAGNTSASADVSGINVDLKAPTISGSASPAANSAGWNNTNVVVTFSCGDDLSDVASCGPNVTLVNEGANQSVEGTVVDNAGNSASETISHINIDKTAPTASASATPSATSFGWNNTDVGVSFSGTDTLSGIASCDPAVTLSAEGAGQLASGKCTDLAGNVSAPAAATVNIDKSAPTASAIAAPSANGFGWNNTDVVVSFSGTDTLSGIASCDPAVTLSTEEAGQQASGKCTDKAGNVSALATATVNIDKTAPPVALVGGPASGGSYYFGFVPAAPTCLASDKLSGLDGTCSVSGYDTTVGSHTITTTATDKAGNSSSATASYTVLAWTLKGFYQPVDMGALNNAKAGSTVPLKFEVFAGSTELTSTSVIQAFTSKINCDASLAGDDIEQYATGGTSLRYDSTGGQFIFNWQTPKTPGVCYLTTVKTQDGSTISASFKLK